MIDYAILHEATSLLVMFGLVTTVCAFLLVYAKVQAWLRVVLIPLVLALTLVGYITLLDVLGKPFPGFPPNKSVLVHYQVDVTLNKHDVPEKTIMMWVITTESHRLYKVPYSRELEVALREADREIEEGKPPRKQIESLGLEHDGSPIRLYEIPWKELMPKDSSPEDQ